MSIPVLGVTTYRNQNTFGFSQFSVSEAYVQSLTSAGAIPVLIPLGLSEEYIDEILPRVDGILFTGGGDIHPDNYKGEDHPLVNMVDLDRDRIELYLLRKIMAQKKPLMGICRGFQVINVGLGGSLYEDILDQRSEALRHAYFPEWPRDYLAHPVRIEPGSQLESILGAAELPVNSLHHQGIKDLAPGITPTAYAPDGLIEGIEIDGYPFGLAVQWHPENLQMHEPMRLLFQAFVTACQRKE